MNVAILIGNLGHDPEIRYTKSGTAVCNFSLATNKEWTNKDGEKQKKTEWHRIVAYDKRAEILAEYLNKGSRLAVRGEIQYRQWEDKEGRKMSTPEIIVEHFEFLSTSTPADRNDVPF